MYILKRTVWGHLHCWYICLKYENLFNWFHKTEEFFGSSDPTDCLLHGNILFFHCSWLNLRLPVKLQRSPEAVLRRAGELFLAVYLQNYRSSSCRKGGELLQGSPGGPHTLTFAGAASRHSDTLEPSNQPDSSVETSRDSEGRSLMHWEEDVES